MNKSSSKPKVNKQKLKRQLKHQAKVQQSQGPYQALKAPQLVEPPMPKVAKVALGVRAALVESLRQRRMEELRRMRESQSKATE